MVRERAVIHNLQEHVKEVRVRFLNLIEEQYTVRMLVHSVRQQAALVKAHIARRGTNQAGDGVTLHIFRHVEPVQLNAQKVRKLARDFRFAHARRAAEQIGTNRLIRLTKARARQFDGSGQRLNGIILPEHHPFQVVFKREHHAAFVAGHGFRWDARDLGNDGFHILHANRLLAP